MSLSLLVCVVNAHITATSHALVLLLAIQVQTYLVVAGVDPFSNIAKLLVLQLRMNGFSSVGTYCFAFRVLWAAGVCMLLFLVLLFHLLPMLLPFILFSLLLLIEMFWGNDVAIVVGGC